MTRTPLRWRPAVGWAVLSLIPLTLVALAAAAHQLAELAVGAGIAAFLCLAVYVGLRLLDGGRQP